MRTNYMMTVDDVMEELGVKRSKAYSILKQLNDELAKEGITISYKAISNWERNLAEPSVTIFYKVCRILGITNMYEAYFGVNPADPFHHLLMKAGKKLWIILICSTHPECMKSRLLR